MECRIPYFKKTIDIEENLCYSVIEKDELKIGFFRYCGEYYDSEIEQIYLRARYYDPSLGRFTQQDTHWTPENMIYGDEQKAERIIVSQSKYWDIKMLNVERQDLGNIGITSIDGEKLETLGANLVLNNVETVLINNILKDPTKFYSVYEIVRVPNINAIIQANNLYVYTGNNPLMYSDKNGEFWGQVICKVIWILIQDALYPMEVYAPSDCDCGSCY